MTRIRSAPVTIFRLAHLSDPHLPPPRGAFGWQDVVSKRLLSRIAWRRKHREHQPDVLAALVADIKAYAPDHIALTGDLTNFAAGVEVQAARVWLESLGPPDRVTLSPGNHDALVGAADATRFSAWAPWLGDDGEAAFPQVRRRGDLAIFNLCSAVPTAPHLATGRLGEAQLSALEALLADPAHRDAFRVVLIHHPPTRGAVSRRKALEDQPALAAVLKRQGADLVLHGHAHEALVGSLPGPDSTTIPVLGVPSASAVGEGKHPAARWHAIEVERDADRQSMIRVIARGLDAETRQPVELGRYLLA
jgi:3',5'-cyclic AMP phosphodiesterase CpdA